MKNLTYKEFLALKGARILTMNSDPLGLERRTVIVTTHEYLLRKEIRAKNNEPSHFVGITGAGGAGPPPYGRDL